MQGVFLCSNVKEAAHLDDVMREFQFAQASEKQIFIFDVSSNNSTASSRLNAALCVHINIFRAWSHAGIRDV